MWYIRNTYSKRLGTMWKTTNEHPRITDRQKVTLQNGDKNRPILRQLQNKA